MDKVFNTEFEFTLRIVLLLAEAKTSLDASEISVIDFISTYSGAFSGERDNINGNNRFKFNEYASRKALAASTVKQMVLDGLLTPVFSDKGFTYSLSDSGNKFASSLDSDYAAEYRRAARFAIGYVASNGVDKVLRRINRNKTNAKDD